MAGGKSEGSTNPSAVRIRDNQRRSRARHKEYVEGLQRKVQDYERRGVEATLEMQQAARNVAVENSRLRMLLGYHGVTGDEVDKFLQAFPDQSASDAAKATISQTTASQPPMAPIAPKIPIQPPSRPPSTGPLSQKYPVPPIAREGSTREVLDAIVGIKREPRLSEASSSTIAPASIPAEQRQQLLPRPQPPILPTLPSLVLGQARPEHLPIDRLSVLASASVQQDQGDGRHHRALSATDSLHIPSPDAVGQSPPSSMSGTPGRLSSASPRSYGRRSRSPLDRSTTPRQESTSESSQASVNGEIRDGIPVRTSTISRFVDQT
ncbi:hypothetical protein B0T10DRAFT_559051 [Thelonectria olida]|uniref:BZIP domain-containing protein n=1 Tax=Thelonectria olida TaxID=1576542 RepID=A0A9P9AP83_9HYPO|nr:hypothetical protein B0T10DRAFT_559051 [Thelonectria olida]